MAWRSTTAHKQKILPPDISRLQNRHYAFKRENLVNKALNLKQANGSIKQKKRADNKTCSLSIKKVWMLI